MEVVEYGMCVFVQVLYWVGCGKERGGGGAREVEEGKGRAGKSLCE